MIILLHTSKTMRHSGGDRAEEGRAAPSPGRGKRLRRPQLLARAKQLDAYLKTLSPGQLAKIMSLSPALAKKTHGLIAGWTAEPARQTLAVDSFVGDIYSGLQAPELSPADREYADKTLFILSGLYGVIRPLDGIYPYRLEMGYKLPDPKFANLYDFWGDSIAACLPAEGPIVNLAAVEYSKTVTPFVDAARVVAPKFLTVSAKTGEPEFVVVHAKIARGAFAHWLIASRTQRVSALNQFNEIGYRYSKELSTPDGPVFVCEEFGGKGLSLRLQ